MIVSLSSPGCKCQVGDFVMFVDPASDRKADLILKTKTDLPIGFPLSPEVVAGSGEYEIGGVRVKGMSLENEANGQTIRTIYAVLLEGVKLAFLGELQDEPDEESLGKLGKADILFLSADSGKLKAKQLTSLIKQIDPKIIIPISDKTAKLLAEELGQKVKAEEKLVIKKKDLDKEQIVSKLVWLKSGTK
ncbi:MAG: MBL fold metallo-hydrolase [Candidatus Colwellbacteria bacterium]|nr:MBL fold metallo-hydrolase [Candidatus Colwellbacteria bacterium]